MVTKKDKYLVAAQKFLERGQLDKALAEFAKVVQEDPKDTRTWLKMAELHAKRGAADQATEIYLKTGELYTEQGFFQKAVAVYKNVLKLSPSYVQGHLRLADVYKRLGLMSDAIQQYDMAAFAFQKIGKSAEALAALREIVEVNPENVISRIKLAESASQAGATDEAIREFALAAEQLKAQGRSDEYVRVAERLLFHQPDNVDVARELAETYISKNNPRLALAKLQACLKVDPRDPRNVALLARAFEQLDVPKAVSVWRELAQIQHDNSRFPERDVAIRKALLLDGRDAEAQEMARRYGISVGPSHATPPPLPPGMAGTGVGASTLRPLGPLAPASGLYPTAPPSSSSSGVRRGAALSDAAGTSGVRPAGAPSSAPDISRIMAESDVFVKYGLLDRAVDHLRRAFEIQPDFLPAREKLAAVLAQLGRKKEAAAELEYMAEHVARSDRGQAVKLAERARALDPGAARAGALLDGGEAHLEPPSGPLFTGARRGPDTASRPAPGRAPAAPQRPPRAVTATRIPAVDEGRMPEVSLGRMSGDDFLDDELPGALPDDLVADLSDAEIEDADLEALSMDDLDIEVASDDDDGDPAAGLLTPPPEIVSTIAASLAPGASPGRAAAGRFDPASGPIAAPAAAPEPAADPDLLAELAEVDFFISQGIPDEARSLLQDLRVRYSSHPLVEKKIAEVDPAAARPDRPAAVSGPSAPLGAVPREPPARIGHRGAGDAPVAVVADGEKADLSTHGDLGIAYKEMGLYDPAIAEFKQLTQDPKREVFALTMIGECCEAKGLLTDAIIRYKEALNCPQITPEETIQLYFCLGSTFERLSDRSEALYFYEKVAKRDPKFRDVDGKIAALKPRSARQA